MQASADARYIVRDLLILGNRFGVFVFVVRFVGSGCGQRDTRVHVRGSGRR